jgi:hypothetical protein
MASVTVELVGAVGGDELSTNAKAAFDSVEDKVCTDVASTVTKVLGKNPDLVGKVKVKVESANFKRVIPVEAPKTRKKRTTTDTKKA